MPSLQLRVAAAVALAVALAAVASTACGGGGGGDERQDHHRHQVRPARPGIEEPRRHLERLRRRRRRIRGRAARLHARGQIEWKESPSAQRETLIQNGQVNFIAATYSITDARKEKVDFAGPYLITGQSLLVRADNTDITGAESLQNNKKLCSVSGSTPAQSIKDKYAGRAAAAVRHLLGVRRGAEERRGRRRHHRRGHPRRLRGADARASSRSSASRSPRSSYGIGLKKGDTELRPRSTTRSRKMEADGAWKAAFDKNLGPAGIPAPAPPTVDQN